MTTPKEPSLCGKCQRPAFYDGAPEDRQYCLCELESPAKPEPEKCKYCVGGTVEEVDIDTRSVYHYPCRHCQPTPKSGGGPIYKMSQEQFQRPADFYMYVQEVRSIFAQGQAQSQREVEELKAKCEGLDKCFKEEQHLFHAMMAERDQLKARWEKLRLEAKPYWPGVVLDELEK